MKKFKILVVYRHPIYANAPTIMDHINSFSSYSSNYVIKVNTEYGFPKILNDYHFDIIIFHYSLFGLYPFFLPESFVKYAKFSKDSVKVAFFQDEFQYCLKRFRLIDDLNISVVYSLLESKYLKKVYGRCESIKHVFSTLAGYVSEDLVTKARDLSRPYAARRIDFGYRARSLPYLLGKGGQEKTNIALEFSRICQGKQYTLDISTDNDSRIYGDEWYRFVANCKAMLGVEAGVSLFDIDGNAERACNEFLSNHSSATFQQTYDTVLSSFEESERNVYYRMISPRIFEAAAFKVCMILFEGSYSNILEPGVHYIPLKKNFSNIDFVLAEFNDPRRRDQLMKNAYDDLIVSKQYSYRHFVDSVDGDFADLGISSSDDVLPMDRLSRKLERRESNKRFYMMAKRRPRDLLSAFRKFLKKSS